MERDPHERQSLEDKSVPRLEPGNEDKQKVRSKILNELNHIRRQLRFPEPFI